MNVGACVGAKTGAATSVGGMMTTFDECGEFWKMGRSGDQILSLGPRYVSDFCADVCSRQATRPVLMRLIGGRRKQHCRGLRMAYISGCASFPWRTSAPVAVFRQRLGRGASLTPPARRA